MSETNYYFDAVSQFRPFTVSTLANAGSIAPENALRKKPTFKAGYWPCESGGKWVQIEDYREKKGWLNGEETTITELGPLPDGWSDTPPPPTSDELMLSLRSQRNARIADSDKYLLPDYPISEPDLAAVKAYRQILRDLPEQPGAPWDGGGSETPWPETPNSF